MTYCRIRLTIHYIFLLPVPESVDHSAIARFLPLTGRTPLEYRILSVSASQPTLNNEAHNRADEGEKALNNLALLYELCVWYMQTYGDYGYNPVGYVPSGAAHQSVPPSVPRKALRSSLFCRQLPFLHYPISHPFEICYQAGNVGRSHGKVYVCL